MVSVVMSVYNGERFLPEAVESILDQTFRDFEFIVINDGSTDATADVIARYARADTRVRVFEQGNQGLIYSLNKGCALAQAKYIARIDPDDIALPHRLERQVRFLEEMPDVAVVGGGFYLLGRGGAVVKAALFPQFDHDIKQLLRESWCCIIHPTVMMRADAFRAVGGYRRAFVAAEDYDLWLRLAERTALANLPEPLIYYRVHCDQVSCMRIEAQAAASVAARASARCRLRGYLDPFDLVQELTPETMGMVGVTDRQLADAIARAYCAAASSLLAAGYTAQARTALTEGIAACAQRPLSRAGVGELRWASAKIHLRERQLARALLTAFEAFCSNPSMTADLLTLSFWRRLGRFARPGWPECRPRSGA